MFNATQTTETTFIIVCRGALRRNATITLYQSTTRVRANKTNDSEVIAFLREMKSEMQTKFASINSKIDDINNSVNSLKSENDFFFQKKQQQKT